MNEITTAQLTRATMKNFNDLKAGVASTMSFDEFLNVLLAVYRTQQEVIKAKGK